jgi:hypothetical protein
MFISELFFKYLLESPLSMSSELMKRNLKRKVYELESKRVKGQVDKVLENMISKAKSQLSKLI